MTKKDFEFIALSLYETLTLMGEGPDYIKDMATLWANRLQHTNPRFDRARFIAAATRKD